MKLHQIRTLLHERTGLDRAIGFSLIGRVWSTLAGIVNVFLIARFMTPRQQGFYYTFYSLVAIQIIFELGFSFVILQLAAHERAQLTLHPDGTFTGPETSQRRLASILKRTIRWYSGAAAIMAIALLVIGSIFFSRHNQGGSIEWRVPWYCLVFSNSLLFQMDPIISFVEGCGRVVDVGRLRMSQGMVGSLFAWAALSTRHGLYAPAMVLLGQSVSAILFLYSNCSMLRPLLKLETRNESIHWKTEVWPFQWRTAVSWASSYFIIQTINPIAFAFCGATRAGQLGMSINISTALGNVALSWMTTKAAPFGSLVARRAYDELDRLFFRSLKQSTVMLLTGVAALVGGLPLAFLIAPRFQTRVLPLPLFALVLSTTVCSHIVVSEAYYLRAHKREPFLIFWVLLALLSAGTLSSLARRWNIEGIVMGYFLIAGVLRLCSATFVFVQKRRQWHSA